MPNPTLRRPSYIRHCVLITVIALSAFTSACSSNNSAGPIQNLTERDERRIAKLKEDELYQRARKALDSGAWDSALQLYNDIELRYPFSETARQAQLEALFAHYRLFQEDLVVSLANQFITQYPRHPHVDYAHYMKGLANFRRATPDIGSWFRTDNSLRDPGYARESFFAFSRLVNSLPNSDYAHDAHLRMLFLRERLAKHQWHIIEYYQRKNGWVAVINRAKLLLEDYAGSSFTQPALKAMAQAYSKLGMTELAEDAHVLAQLNAPTPQPNNNKNFSDSELEQLIPALKSPE
jgi:outer membrane protein assembly factor BamD